MSEFFIGIDLGTTNTLACYLKKGKPEFFSFAAAGNNSLLPSVLYVDEEQKIHVGKKASNLAVFDPLNGIRSSKTYMADFGKKWECNGLTFTPTDVATEILKVVYRAVSKRLKCEEGDTINAVITVPAYFTSNQTDETKKAGIAAGFNVRQIITEPMSAAVAAVRELALDKKVFVVDLGGGTFDLSVLEADHGSHSYTTIDIDGDRRLGGDDFDQAIYQYFLEIIQSDLGLDLSDQKRSGLDYNEYHSMTGQVLRAAEQAKIELSEGTVCEISLPNLFVYNGRNYDFFLELSRETFDDICEPLYERILSRIRKFIENSGKFRVEEIESIILAGGSCYIPRIQTEVAKIFNKSANSEIDRSKLVAIGACFVAEAINGGIEINPQDIISHSLGVEAASEDGKSTILSKILLKGDVYPCAKTKNYSTTRDNQTSIPINVYEAGSDCENIQAIEKHDFYGSLTLEGIEPAPKGTPDIEVKFSYDNSRVLTVTAVDLKTGKSKEVQIRKGEKPASPTASQPVSIMLLLDTSGSMTFDGGKPLKQAKEACGELFGNMIDLTVHEAGLITFNSRAELLISLTHERERLLRCIQEISAYGGTELKDALVLAHDDLQSSKGKKVILIVTDGQANDRDVAIDYAGSLKRSDCRIVSIGVGGDIRKEFLDSISSKGDSYTIENMGKLKSAFAEVIEKIVEIHN